jgi:hypothetical protein
MDTILTLLKVETMETMECMETQFFTREPLYSLEIIFVSRLFECASLRQRAWAALVRH